MRSLPLLLAVFSAAAVAEPAPDLLRHVDPRIGVLGEGATVIGPSLPFGSIHPSPDTADGDNDGYKPGKPIRGFSQLHVSGTGWGQYGNVLLSPQIGLATGPLEHDSPAQGERAAADRYEVSLSRWNVHAAVSPTAHAAIYSFRFPRSDQAHVVLDASQHIPGDIAAAMFPGFRKPVTARVEIGADGRSVSGEGRFPGGFGGPYTLYFYAELERAPAAFGTFRDGAQQAGQQTIASDGTLAHVGAWFRFDTRQQNTLHMKVAVSFHSVARARAYLQAEIGGWDAGAVRAAAAARWRQALDAIEVEGGSEAQRSIFYTALYHTMSMPRDRRGEFARFDPGAPMIDDHYAIWDTWRTLFPLLAMIRPDIVRDTVNSFIERQRVDGSVGDTFVAGQNQLREQGGNAVDMVIADAHARRVPGIDWEQAYGVIRHDADFRRSGANFDRKDKGPGPYRGQGWIPAGIMSVSMSLEYAYNDYVAGQLAAALGKEEDARRWTARSRQWTALWNPGTESDGYKGFVMPREADGAWLPFDTKAYPGSWKNYFYEANSWTYSYFAPHQAARLIELMGGRTRFVERLEYAFEHNLIDLFNEPSFLVPQLFHYAGRPDLAAKWTARITSSRYTLTGYPGDDDSGAMSSYYVWGKLGLFPNAGQDVYLLNGPAFASMTVRRPGRGALRVRRSGKGDYVAGVKLNGVALTRSWLRQADIDGPCLLEFTMSETPTAWARDAEPPPSLP